MGQPGAMGKLQLCDSHINGRLQNTVKYEREVYLRAYAGVREAKRKVVGAFFRSRDTARPHQALSYRTLAAVFHRNSAP